MKWRNESAAHPGCSVYTAQTPNRQYVIRSKRGLGVWRMFVKEDENPLRTVFVGSRLRECKEYAEQYEETNSE